MCVVCKILWWFLAIDPHRLLFGTCVSHAATFFLKVFLFSYLFYFNLILGFCRIFRINLLSFPDLPHIHRVLYLFVTVKPSIIFIFFKFLNIINYFIKYNLI